MNVHPLSTDFRLEIAEGDEKIEFKFHQLDYKLKSQILNTCMVLNGGKLVLDSHTQTFLNVKFGLKEAKGLLDADGNEYQLEYDDKVNKYLSDKCVNELFASGISEKLTYVANQLSDAMLPKQILHPLTNQPIDGITILETDPEKK